MTGTVWSLRPTPSPAVPPPPAPPNDSHSASPTPIAPAPRAAVALDPNKAEQILTTYDDMVRRVHARLIAEIDNAMLDGIAAGNRRAMVERAARTLVTSEDPRILPHVRDVLVAAIADEVTGLGPIEPLYRDPSISEIMVNAPDQVYVEREGRMLKAPVRFRDHAHILQVIDRIVSPLGRRIDETSPMVDARLPDGSRVNAVVPPLTPKSPSITIRKFRSDRLAMPDLIAAGSLTEAMAMFLGACIRLRLNVLISGGTGSGKTTMMNALSEVIPDTERIVTIEDPAELQLKQEHVVSLEARPAGVEGRTAVSQRDLVRNALRMRPDRIIVGEVRGGEAFDMLQAMNTGHDGSISTVHANSPRDAVSRVENMVLMAGLELPARAIREQIASAIQLIVQLSRFRDGRRRITAVSEIAGMEGDIVTMQDIFIFEQRGIDSEGKVLGDWRPTGLRPRFADRFAQEGIAVPNEIYQTKAWR